MALVSERTKAILDRAKRCRRNFEEFFRFVVGYPPAEHQAKWIIALQDLADNPDGARLLIVAPPGSGKTTLMVAFIAWMIGRDPEQHYGLLSYADQVGWSRSRAVRELIESKYYRIVFPEIEPGQKWGDTEFIVQRPAVGDPHPTLRAGGTNSSVIGSRLNGLLLDDPHDQKNSANTEQREKVYDNYQKVVRTRLTSKAWVVVIGTRWAEEDLIGRLLKQKKKWVMVVTAALKKRGGELESYWPDHYPLEMLEDMRFDDPKLFSLQYMHDTSGGEHGIIRQVKNYHTSPTLAREAMDLVIASAWDTALKDHQQSDFSVCYTGGMAKDGRIYILDRRKDRFSLPEIMEQTNEINEEFSPYAIYFEDTANGTPAVQTIMANLPHIPTIPVPYSSGGKSPRAHSLAPYLHGGHVLFPAYEDWFKDCQYQLTHFPLTDHDDDVDALYILVINLINIVHPANLYDRPAGPRIVMR